MRSRFRGHQCMGIIICIPSIHRIRCRCPCPCRIRVILEGEAEGQVVVAVAVVMEEDQLRWDFLPGLIPLEG